MQRRYAYAAAGVLLSAGAPAGLLAVRLGSRTRQAGSPSRRDIRAELSADCPAYTYVGLSTALVLAAFGYVLGRHADGLARLSETDPLTGLINARGLYDSLQHELARARRYRTPLALLVLDLDGLKIINDRFGHRAGDEALRTLAEAVRSELRDSDVGARWGGDEFAIIAPNTSREAAAALAERIRALIADRSSATPLSVSLGVAMFEPDGPCDISSDSLMHEADAAMYAAKAQGRNRVVMAG